MLYRAVRRRDVHGRHATQADVLHVQSRLSVRPADGNRNPGVLSAARVRREGVPQRDRPVVDDRLPATHRRDYSGHVRRRATHRYRIDSYSYHIHRILECVMTR